MDQTENFLKRGSTNTSHHKNWSLRKTKIVFLQKWIISQKVFYTKILHFTWSIFYIKNIMLQILFFTKKLHKWHRLWITLAWNRQSGLGFKPRTNKKLHCFAQGLNLGPTKITQSRKIVIDKITRLRGITIHEIAQSRKL